MCVCVCVCVGGGGGVLAHSLLPYWGPKILAVKINNIRAWIGEEGALYSL